MASATMTSLGLAASKEDAKTLTKQDGNDSETGGKAPNPVDDDEVVDGHPFCPCSSQMELSRGLTLFAIQYAPNCHSAIRSHVLCMRLISAC
ncbi:hypothetical protein IV203_022989 [Nitzschia inconspicua]|uniref:Uncharacterized protein n=1 Tax=Nitzschia inconspicua TaxID=303405 RepID=A0A9K3PB75_9STRA|nr:hypothetical protein IV203_022989 [Nitzschia inconspicua]